jgi:hypothetical protein
MRMRLSDPAETGQKGVNMSATRTKHSTHTARGDSASVLTALRGRVRRLPQGVEKQRAELLASQIKERVPAPYLARQIALMGGRQ